MGETIHRAKLTLLTDEQSANNQRAHQLAIDGNPLSRAEWAALGIPDAGHGRRCAQLSNAISHRLYLGAIPLEWVEEFNAIVAEQQLYQPAK